MRGRYGQPLRWTPERVAEAIAEWDRTGSSIAAAAELAKKWGEPLTGAQLRNAVYAAERHGTAPAATRPAQTPAVAQAPAAKPQPPDPPPLDLSEPRTIAVNPAWLGPEVSGWSQGWGVATLAPGRRPTLDVIRYEAGAAYWGGRRV